MCEDVVGGFREVCESWEQFIRKEPTDLEALEMEVG